MNYLLGIDSKDPSCRLHFDQHASDRSQADLEKAILKSPVVKEKIRNLKGKVSGQIRIANGQITLQLGNEESTLTDLDETQVTKFLVSAEKCQTAFNQFKQLDAERELAKAANPTPLQSRGVRVLNLASRHVSVGSDMMSVAANTMAVAEQTILRASPAAHVIGEILPILGGVRSVFWLFIGLRLIKKSLEQLVRAHSHKDGEGGALASLNAVSGAGLTVLGLDMAIGTLSLPIAVTATAALALAATIGGYVMYVATLLYSIHGLVTNGIFQYRLNQLSHSENALQESFAWLKDQVMNEEDTDSMQGKWDRLERRIGPQCSQMLQQMLMEDPTLAHLEEHSVAAEKLLAEIKLANRRQLVTHTIFFVIGVLGIAAMAVGGPAVAAALFVIGAILWILVDSSAANKWITHKICPDLDPEKSLSQFASWDALKTEYALKIS